MQSVTTIVRSRRGAAALLGLSLAALAPPALAGGERRDAAAPAPAAAAPAPSAPAAPSTPAQPAAGRKDMAELLVPPGGGAFEVPIHPNKVCILSFFEPLDQHALTSPVPGFDIRSWGPNAAAVLAHGRETMTTLALATATGTVKINVKLRVVPLEEAALSFVSFRAVTQEEAMEAQVAAEVARRLLPLQAELDADRKKLEERIRSRAELLVVERALKRSELISLSSHERNDANVVAHVKQAMVLGELGYLFFELENRGLNGFRVARVALSAAGKPVASQVRLVSASIDKDPQMIGVVQGGTTARGVVVVPAVDALLGKPLSLELSGPQGRGAFRLTRGIVIK